MRPVPLHPTPDPGQARGPQPQQLQCSPWPSSGGHLAWWLHPWHSSEWMPSHASSVVSVMHLYTLCCHAGKISSFGFRNGNMVEVGHLRLSRNVGMVWPWLITCSTKVSPILLEIVAHLWPLQPARPPLPLSLPFLCVLAASSSDLTPVYCKSPLLYSDTGLKLHITFAQVQHEWK